MKKESKTLTKTRRAWCAPISTRPCNNNITCATPSSQLFLPSNFLGSPREATLPLTVETKGPSHFISGCLETQFPSSCPLRQHSCCSTCQTFSDSAPGLCFTRSTKAPACRNIPWYIRKALETDIKRGLWYGNEMALFHMLLTENAIDLFYRSRLPSAE